MIVNILFRWNRDVLPSLDQLQVKIYILQEIFLKLSLIIVNCLTYQKACYDLLHNTRCLVLMFDVWTLNNLDILCIQTVKLTFMALVRNIFWEIKKRILLIECRTKIFFDWDISYEIHETSACVFGRFGLHFSQFPQGAVKICQKRVLVLPRVCLGYCTLVNSLFHGSSQALCHHF